MESGMWVIGLMLGSYLFYKLFFSSNEEAPKQEPKTDVSFHDILNSDKYKVKGQYDDK